MPTSLRELTAALQTLFTTTAARAARNSHFIRRRRVLDGPSFVQGLVFGWLDHPRASLEELILTLAEAGADLSAQALDQRFTEAAAHCLRLVLAAALQQVIAADPRAQPLVERFHGVYLLDSTTVPLPAALADRWPGCGGRTAAAGKAALKIQVRWEVGSGTLDGMALSAGRHADATAELASAALPAGALRLADLGYFDLSVLAEYDRAGVFWLSRVPPRTRLYVQGQKWELGAFLKHQDQDRVDRAILLGTEEKRPCRLIALRVPAGVAAARRRRARTKAKKSGHRLSAERLALCDWTVVATNLPPEQLTLEEALVLLGVRWQLEKAQADYPSRRRWGGARRSGYHRHSGVARAGRVVPATPGRTSRRSRMSSTIRRPTPPRA